MKNKRLALGLRGDLGGRVSPVASSSNLQLFGWASVGGLAAICLVAWELPANATVIACNPNASSAVSGCTANGGFNFPAIDGTGYYSNVTGAGASGAGLSSATVYGSFANVTGPRATAIGLAATAAQGAIAIGSVQFTGQDAVTGAPTGGTPTAATGLNSIAIGGSATATSVSGVALGAGSVANRAGLTGALEAFSNTAVASTQGAFSVGAAGAERQIINVAGGTVDTDAVNVRQLRAVGNSVAASIGGGAAFDPNTNAYIAPNFTVNGANYNNIGAAITALDAGGGGGAGVFASDNTAAAAAPVATGANSSAGGYGSSATGAASTVVGNGARDNGNANAVAVGNNASVLGAGSIAIGQGTTANTSNNLQNVADFRNPGGPLKQINNLPAGTTGFVPTGTAIGTLSTVGQGGGVAIGYNNNAGNTVQNQVSTAIGANNLASGVNSIALGLNNTASNRGSIAIGTDSQSTGLRSIAMGREAYAFGDFSMAQGYLASSYGPNSLAFGPNSVAGVNGGAAANDIAIGSGATSTLGNSIALGAGSVASRGAETGYTGYAVGATTSTGELAVGTAAAPRTITGVSAGRLATDAVNVSQLGAVGSNLATSLGGGAAFDPTSGAYTAPGYTVGGQTYNNVGAALNAGNALAVQYTPNGAGAPTNAIDLTKGGTLAPVAMTGLANATTATGAVTLGQTPLQYSTAGAPTTPNPAVPSNDVTLVGANAGAPVSLHNLAAGALTATSTDAVNGSQLFGVSNNVDALGTTTAAAIGGNSVYTPGVGITGTNYTLNGAAAPFTNVVAGQQALANGAAGPVQYATPGTPSNALNLVGTGGPVTLGNVAAGTLSGTSTEAVNGSQLYATNQQVIGLQNGTSGLVQQAAPGAVITVGAGTDGTTVSFANNVGTARRLLAVANGTVGANSTDAVNGGQLYGTANSVATVLGGGAGVAADGTVTAPTYTVAGANYNDVGSAIGAIDNGLANGQVGAFRADNTAGLAAPAASGANSVAGGFGASATGAASTVVGNGATDNGNANSTVLGNGASVTAGLAGSNVALGQGSAATRGAENYIGYGVGAQTSAGEVAVGTPAAARTITGVAAGRLGTDAVNVAQLQAVGGNLAASLGGGAGFDPTTGVYTVPIYNVANGTYNDVGSALSALDNGIASGQFGAFRSDNTAGAAGPAATGANSVAGGFGASATGAASTVIGNGATDNGNANVTVLGNGASVAAGLTGSNVALGQGSAAGRGALANYDAFGLAPGSQTSAGEVAVGTAAAPRQVTGVAAGSQATDAVNVAQLQGAASNLGTSTAAALGGGSAYDPATGQITAPTYSLNNGTQTYNNVGDAIGNLDGRTTSNTNAIAGLQNGTSGLVQQDPVGRGITVGAQTDGTTVGFANNAGAARTLTGVAAGNVAVGSTEAVNGGQLYANSASVATALGGGAAVNPDGTVSAPTYAVNGTNYNNVGGAITALDSTGVKYDTVPGGGKGQSITLAGGDPNQPVVIHNVAAGTARTDAANTGQVQDAEARANQYTNQRVAGIQNQVSGMNDRISGLESNIAETKREARQGAAIGLAAASLRYDDRPGKVSVAAGGGYWRGEAAGAFGIGYTLPDGRFRVNATAATTGTAVGVGAGATYTFN